MFLNAPGEPIAIDELTIAKAKAFATYLASGKHPYAELVDARRDAASGDETIVCDLIVEVSQDRVNPILDVERIAVSFSGGDDRMPEALALRDNFPLVPHLNQRLTEFPRSLCLYELPYTTIKLRWTPATFVERIRQWLEQSSAGTLHQEDQPLEPVFLGRFTPLIVPSNFLQTIAETSLAGAQSHFAVYATGASADQLSGLVVADSSSSSVQPANDYIATAIIAPTQTHGIVRKTPASLEDVIRVAQEVGIDLLHYLRRFVQESRERNPNVVRARLILVLIFPKRRHDRLEEETWEWWGFLIGADIRDLGDRLGIWESQTDGTIATLIVPAAATTCKVPVQIVNPVTQLTKRMAATFSGTSEDNRRCVMVGVGAIGSITLVNLLRKGFGCWDIVDDDLMMPHNGARHALPASCAGAPKITGMRHLADNLYEEAAVVSALNVNVLQPALPKEDLANTFRNAQLIADCSADIAVARHLAIDVETEARRLSLFLSPDGEQLVLLLEDGERHARLDALEMQFYHLLLGTAELCEHYGPAGKKLRYGRSCRDLSAVLSSDALSTLAGIASRSIERSLSGATAEIRVWKMGKDGSVQLFSTPVREVYTSSTEQFTIVWDEGVVDKLRWLRGEKLPGETGGALLGCWDLSRSRLYIVDVTGAPSDSVERPKAFIRGSKELPEWIRSISRITGGAAEYVGEWHSHPDGCGTAPSGDDRQVFSWIDEHLAIDGLPALMLIVGDAELRWITSQTDGGETWKYRR